jgi:hypothetical protein
MIDRRASPARCGNRSVADAADNPDAMRRTDAMTSEDDIRAAAAVGQLND